MSLLPVLSALAGVALFAPAVLTQEPGSGAAAAANGRFSGDLRRLTSDEMAGREPGTPGGQAAELYLAQRFDAVGLVPLVDGFLQQFEVEDPRPARVERSRTLLSTRRRGRSAAFTIGDDFLPFRFSPDGHVTGRLVFVGYGVDAPGRPRDGFAGVDVRGAVVLVVRGGPGWRDRDAPGALQRSALTFAAKAARAARAGAVAMLVVDVDDPAASPRLALTARGTAELPIAWVSRAAASALLGDAGFDRFEPGNSTLDTPRTDLQTTVDLGVALVGRRPPRRTANVIGAVLGSDGERSDEVVVVGAHHDHLGRGAFGSRRARAIGVVHPGADDNASGCAALLEVARAIASGPPPRRTIVFVAFGAEEYGMRGSTAFLADGPLHDHTITAMVNLNMVGRATPDRLRVEGVGTGAGLGDLVGRAMSDVGVAAQVRDSASPRSDHAPFLAANVPALFVHSGLHDAYHTPADVASAVLVPEGVAVARLVTAVVRRLAALESAPAFRSAPAGSGDGR